MGNNRLLLLASKVRQTTYGCHRPGPSVGARQAQKQAMVSQQPPTGTITFLFTDIEGSTRLWQAQPRTMEVALRRHDAILRRVIGEHGGHVFKTVGDAFYAAFRIAPDAIAAALEAQRALGAEQWPDEIGAIRVRMALHTGSADERDGDYFGPALNQVARLLAAGKAKRLLIPWAVLVLIVTPLLFYDQPDQLVRPFRSYWLWYVGRFHGELGFLLPTQPNQGIYWFLSLLFIFFLINRVLSGLAEAAARGADEAIAYDALQAQGMADQWGRVLDVQMRLRSVMFILTMTIGAAVYDRENGFDVGADPRREGGIFNPDA